MCGKEGIYRDRGVCALPVVEYTGIVKKTPLKNTVNPYMLTTYTTMNMDTSFIMDWVLYTLVVWRGEGYIHKWYGKVGFIHIDGMERWVLDTLVVWKGGFYTHWWYGKVGFIHIGGMERWV
jgi:hypothetical protein